MFTSNDINLQVTMDTILKKYRAQDNTDYATLGQQTNNLFGLVVVTHPDGSTLSLQDVASPFIDIAGGSILSADYDPPLDTYLQTPLFGNYNVVYTVQKRYSIAVMSLVSGSADITLIGDQTGNIQVGDTLTISGSTADDGDYTVESLVFNAGPVQTVVTVSANMSTTEAAAGVFGFTVSRTYKFCYEDDGPDLNIKTSYDCSMAIFKSEDASDYEGKTVTAREHRIQYPRRSNGSEVAPDELNITVAQNQILLLNNLWTGGYTSSITSTGNHTQADGLVVLWTRTGNLETIVVCDSLPDQAAQCIAKILTEYEKHCDKNTPNPYQCALTAINTSYVQIMLYRSRNERTLAEKYSQKIIDIANHHGCGCNMNDTASEPVQITASTVIDSIVLGWQTPLTTAGDMYYRNGSNEDARLPVGAENTVMTSVGGVPVWHRPQGHLLKRAIGTFSGDVIPEYTTPGNATVKDGDGYVFNHFVRLASAMDVNFQFGGGAQQLSHTFSGATVAIVRGYVYRLGSNWKMELAVFDTVSTSIARYEGSFAATGSIEFSDNIDISVDYTTPGLAIILDHVVEWQSIKTPVTG